MDLPLKGTTNGFHAMIECQCKVKITLGKYDGKLIPSNFYRHLKSPGCKFMNRLLKEQIRDEYNNENNSNPPTALSSQLKTKNSQLATSSVTVDQKRSLDSTHSLSSKRQKKT
ncbi:unnamed protein product [Adineta ricciae]|uniref:Uncharacterized protein n=1 Tax=Adineta ricciae TaxID=249248 RepID=A0A815WNE6_ADIRI|nr:unnamed protein product [Adineta ricciae]CAF1653508.1 unnamed protein product [Adineta ricciae]